jgi:hypothetical protein
MSLPFARVAAIVFTTIMGMDSAFADFCSDLNSAMDQQTNFANLKGQKNRYAPFDPWDDSWETPIKMEGAKDCEFARHHDDLFLVCTMKSFELSDKPDGDRALLELAQQIKHCTPEPPFSYITDQTGFTFRDSAHKRGGAATLIKYRASLLDYFDFKTGQTVEVGDWRLQILIPGVNAPPATR